MLTNHKAEQYSAESLQQLLFASAGFDLPLDAFNIWVFNERELLSSEDRLNALNWKVKRYHYDEGKLKRLVLEQNNGIQVTLLVKSYEET